jgi:type I restriction enzyme S subunit
VLDREVRRGFINRNNIYGCEIEKDTTKYALASLIVNNNSLKINILNRCSLSQNNYLFEDKKFDLILTNPPFGTKMTYKELNDKFNVYKKDNYDSSQLNFNDIYPINTNNGASLFIQHVIYMLKDNGICGIVLPDGNELASKTYYNIRKYLIDNCKIIKVINVSGGTFGSTGVKTKVIIFKKQKGTDNHKNIEFLEINKECNELKLIATSDLDNNYSFRLRVKQDIILKDDYEIKTLGEICNILPKSKRPASYGKKSGLYPFFKSSFKVDSYIDEPDYIEESIIIGDGGNANINYGVKFSVSDHCYILQNKDKISINLKYCYYYLFNNIDVLNDLYNGLGLKNINKCDILNIKIPIPSIEIQNKKVEEIDKLEESINTIKLRIEQIKHEQQYILLSKIREYIGTEYVEFGEIFDLIKGTIQSSKVIENENGDGVFINWSIYNKFKKINNNILEGDNLFISTKLPNGKDKGYMVITYYSGKCNYCDLMSLCKLKDNYKDKINIKYIYYYLLEKQEFIEENYQLGCANKSLDIEEFNLMKIPIPSIEKQKEIVDILDGINDRMNGDIKYIEVLRDLISKLI